MKLGKGKNMFVEENIPRNVDTAFFRVKALEAFVEIAIAKKNTLL